MLQRMRQSEIDAPRTMYGGNESVATRDLSTLGDTVAKQRFHRRQRTALVRRRFAAALLPRLFGNNVPGHTTRAPPVWFKLETNGIQFYAIDNLDKTSLERN